MGQVFGIIGVTISGNMGGQAMLEAVIEHVRARAPGARFRLFSIYPADDMRLNTHEDLEIVPVPLWRLLTVDFAGAAGVMLMRALGVNVPVALLPRMLRSVAGCDAMIDVAGIAFVDRRGIPLLVYNLALCLPSFATRTPHHKLSQALGPFETTLNRAAARFALTRVTSLAARGDRTRQYLQAIGIAPVPVLPDVSFALSVGSADMARARASLPQGEDRRPWVAISPSRVVERIGERKGIEYLGLLAGFARELSARGYRILVLPHALADRRSKNNDIEVARRLMRLLTDVDGVLFPDVPGDARLLRALFGQCHAVITSRFHAAVAAVSMGVPVVTIAWSHKYIDMLSPFGLERFVMPVEEVTGARLRACWDAIESEGPAMRVTIANVAADHARRALVNFDPILSPVPVRLLSERSPAA